MWVNPQFHIVEREAIAEMIASNPLATLVTSAPLRASHMPVLVDRWDDTGLVLIGHMPTADPVSRALVAGDPVLAVFTGARAYVSAGWYADPGLPTYNFSAVHITGTGTVLDEEALRAHLSELVLQSEAAKRTAERQQWHPGPSAEARINELLPRIIGFRIHADTVEAKVKLGQNRSAADGIGAAEALSTSTREEDRVIAEQMRAHLHATAEGDEQGDGR